MKHHRYHLIFFCFSLLILTIFSCKETENAPSEEPPSVSDEQSRREPRPLLAETQVDTIDGEHYYVTGTSLFPESDPWLQPPGSNLLPNIYTNAYDSEGREMLHTLPSTPTIPYNLHHGDPVVSKIDPISPTDDLEDIFSAFIYTWSNDFRAHSADMMKMVDLGIDILEGNDIPNRTYSGFPLLHYNGPKKLGVVKKMDTPSIFNGDTIWYNVEVRQLWYDSHIESNTGYLDLSAVQDEPWMVTYTLDVLRRGEDDFSPFAMFFDFNADQQKIAHIAMDQSFFPMEDGTRTVLNIKMPPAKYYDLVYTWGWRMHPPRIQVMEDQRKQLPIPGGTGTMRLDSFEIDVFGPDPMASQAAKESAIAMIGDLSPAKRMWKALRSTRSLLQRGEYDKNAILNFMEEGFDAFRAWKDRTHLPDPSLIDSTADLTLLYVNNTIYGGFTDGGTINYEKWRTRGHQLDVTLKNGDYYWHGYQNVDFGGSRGWENQFKSSVRVGGSGCWFTFGRVYWWKNLGKKFMKLRPAEAGSVIPSVEKIHITYNYEPSRRLRFYQFDPYHHDVGIFSVH